MSSFLLSIGLIVACVSFDYETLRLINDWLPGTSWIGHRQKVLAAMFGAIVSHLCQITFFALALYLLRQGLGQGMLGGSFDGSFASYLYFSAETYTSLGFGDIYPAGQIRLLAGIEALTGLLMISWTATFTYLEMRRYW
jgi:hypothetical protein